MNMSDVTARIPDLADLRNAPDGILRAVGLERRRDSHLGAPSAWLAFGLGVALGVGLGLLLGAIDEHDVAEGEADDL
jgi:hypothetical protein